MTIPKVTALVCGSNPELSWKIAVPPAGFYRPTSTVHFLIGLPHLPKNPAASLISWSWKWTALHGHHICPTTEDNLKLSVKFLSEVWSWGSLTWRADIPCRRPGDLNLLLNQVRPPKATYSQCRFNDTLWNYVLSHCWLRDFKKWWKEMSYCNDWEIMI